MASGAAGLGVVGTSGDNYDRHGTGDYHCSYDHGGSNDDFSCLNADYDHHGRHAAPEGHQRDTGPACHSAHRSLQEERCEKRQAYAYRVKGYSREGFFPERLTPP